MEIIVIYFLPGMLLEAWVVCYYFGTMIERKIPRSLYDKVECVEKNQMEKLKLEECDS